MRIENLLAEIEHLEELIKMEKNLLEESKRIINVYFLHENTDPNRNYDGENGACYNNSFVSELSYKTDGRQKVPVAITCQMEETVAKIKSLYVEDLKAKIAHDTERLNQLLSYREVIENRLNQLEREDEEHESNTHFSHREP